jgi:O-antigen ligase
MKPRQGTPTAPTIASPPARWAWAQTVSGWAVFALGACVVGMPNGLLPFALLMLLSSVLGFGLMRGQAAAMGAPLRTLLWLTLAVVAMALLSVALFEHGLKDVDNRSRFIALPWLALWAFALRPPLAWLWRGCVVGVLAALLVALVQVLRGDARADGWTNAIVLADVVLMLAVVAVQCRPAGSWRVPLAVVAAACAVIVLSGSRGVWLGMAALLLVVVLHARWRSGRVRALVVGGGVLAALVMALSVPALTDQLRVNELQRDMQRFEHGDADSSLGARIERLGVAYDTFLAHPLTGIGIGHFDDAMARLPLCQRGWIKRCHLGHAHNDIAEWGATQGVPGLLLLLAVYGVPLLLFLHLHRAGGRSQFRGPAAAGAMIVVGYVLCGMTQSMFAHQLAAGFYVAAVGVLTGLAAREAQRPARPAAVAQPSR